MQLKGRRGNHAPDHPREYGENIEKHIVTVVSDGSSPRIRGKWGAECVSNVFPRIIPANTGKIADTARGRSWARDHPREYGENTVEDGNDLAHFRIIPANTGKMWSQPGPRCGHSDHPREYGENLPHCCQRLRRVGSSPRIRGKLMVRSLIGAELGIIPANTGRIQRKRICARQPRGSSPRIRGEYSESVSARDNPVDHPREYGEN